MTEAANERAVIGDNNPPLFRADKVWEHEDKATEFLDAAGDWLDLKVIDTEENAGKLVDFLDGLRKRFKEVDDDRKADKKPHDDAGKAVQAAYTPIMDKIKLAGERVKPMQTAWLQKVEAERRAEAARQAEAARKAQEEADKLAAAAAARNDIAGEAEAEAATKAAAKQTKEAERFAKSKAQVRGASGGKASGLRRYVEAKLKNPRMAMMHYQDNPALHDFLTQLANQEARAKGFDIEADKIPGFDLNIVEK